MRLARFYIIMSTYSKIYLQIIFAVRNRQSLISSTWEEKLYKYITGIVQNKNQKMLAINGVKDHIHMLISLSPSCNISDLVREIKKSSNNYIKENNFTKSKFQWQEGFGVFSYSHSQIDKVVKYILNHKEHHKKKSFRDEYVAFLTKYEVGYEEKYLPKFLDGFDKL